MTEPQSGSYSQRHAGPKPHRWKPTRAFNVGGGSTKGDADDKHHRVDRKKYGRRSPDRHSPEPPCQQGDSEKDTNQKAQPRTEDHQVRALPRRHRRVDPQAALSAGKPAHGATLSKSRASHSRPSSPRPPTPPSAPPATASAPAPSRQRSSGPSLGLRPAWIDGVTRSPVVPESKTAAVALSLYQPQRGRCGFGDRPAPRAATLRAGQ